MSSYRVHFFHEIWSTKHREKIITPQIQERLYPYLTGIIRKSGGNVLAMGGMPDHLHLLLEVSNLDHFTGLIRNTKASSTGWLKAEFNECQQFSWQKGFGSFTVSVSQLEIVRNYINTQEAHHKNMSFEDEYRKFLTLHQVKFDERYLFE